MNNRERTLVILTPGFPKDELDSTCLPMQQQLLKTLKAMDPLLNIMILSFQYPYHTGEYEWFGIKVIPFNGRNKGGLSRFLLRRKINAALKRIHNNSPADGLLSFWYGECALVGTKFAASHGLKHFCWILGQDAKKENKYPRRTALAPGELIALSDFLRNEFEKNHGTKPAHLVTAGIDTKLFNPAKTEKDIDILAAGSLIPLKRYDLFVEIVMDIKKDVPGLKAVLLGKGPEMDKLKTLILESGLDTTITLMGELPYPEVLQRMQRTKIFLHPSSYEGFSGVCVEALYGGAHVISFCQAMKQEIEQWHIVRSKEEMTATAISILKNSATIYKKVVFASMERTTQKIKELFFK